MAAKNINDAVLARRQKDVDGFTEYYQGQLDKAVGDRAKELIPMWQRLKFKMNLQIKTLYAEAGATSNLDKATSLMFKADRIAMLKKQIENDLRNIDAQQQGYYTAHLEHEYERSYYTHAWGLEQAAQVNVNVPFLSTMQGLGVVANPWLEDGANYSDRIRANTLYLTQKMKDTVEEAVGMGYTVNEAARKLQSCTDEGYFNSVRLMRTELNRAASQGASDLFMQNADILDEKRWNATLDARTAPKDADNDDERFDLDYDTPANPGVPGKRIPNHPHCRCKYSPVLSALGVSTKERIARGAGDTKTEFGERIYTNARTYRDYSKERGLPDLDERLARDNPTSYLRPGETVESINKKVIRKEFNGKAITVPKPLWETAQKVTTAAIVSEELAATSWADDIKAKISKGVTTEAEVNEIGNTVREQIATRYDELQARIDSADFECNKILKELNTMEVQDGPTYEATLAKYHATAEERDALEKKMYGKRREIVKEVLSEVRPIGPKDTKDAQLWAKGSKVEARKAVEKVREYLPTSWLEKSNAEELKAKASKRGYYMEATLKDYEARGYTLDQLKKWKKADLINGQISLSGVYREDGSGGMLRCAFHEMGHRMEDMVPGIKKLEKQFYDRRTAGEDLRWLGHGYKRTEVTRFDQFLSPYMGKDYGNKETSFYELLSMGIESVFADSYNLKTDADYANFIYGILAAI